jgi:hypothetical protein
MLQRRLEGRVVCEIVGVEVSVSGIILDTPRGSRLRRKMKMRAILIALTMFATGMVAVGQPPSSQGKSGKETLAAIAPNFTDGYAQALKEHRFIIVFFRDKSAFTTQMEAEVRKLRADSKLSAVFLFAESLLPDDQMGMKAAKQLNIQGVPAISVLAADPTMLKELTRYEGVFTFAKMRDGIIADTCKNSKYKDGRDTLDPATAKALGCAAK